MTDARDLVRARLIGIVRLDDVDTTVAAAECAIEAGLTAVEVTFTLSRAAEAIERLRMKHPRTLVGAGTVRSRDELAAAVEAGAQFLVAPGLNAALIEDAQRRGVVMVPGVFTASEIDLAMRLRCDTLKLFPAEPAGPAYLASMLQPFPSARLVPTGGISPANAKAYLSVGAAALAMGSSLFPAGRIKENGPGVVVPLVKEALSAIEEVP